MKVASPILLLVLLTTTTTNDSCHAFQPSLLSHRRQHRRFAHDRPHYSSPLWSSSLSEFNYLLNEDSSVSTPIKSHHHNRRIIQLGDQTKTILASATAVPSHAREAADALAEMQQQQQDSSLNSEDDPFDEVTQFQKIQQYKEQAAKPTVSDKLKSMDLQDLVLTLVLPSIALFAAGRWTYNRVAGKVQANTDSILDSFTKEMIYYDGDFQEMKMCVNDYSKKLVYLGPLKRDKMLKRYLEAYAKRKTVSPQAISSLSYAFTLFKLNEQDAAHLLVTLCREMGEEKTASAGKLLFFGSRILKSPEGVQALRPIKEMIKSSYREASVGEAMVETSQQAMAEAAYRSTVQAGGEKQTSLTVGWEVLGLDRETAERIFKEEAKEGFVSAVKTMYGGQTTRYDKKGHIIDKEGKLVNPEDAEDEDEDDDGPVSNVYECSDCGFTLFVAQGRESKFYGNDFKCPECGAKKDKFKARDDFDE